jgi:uncharacterized protein YcbK (DUF882 family)
MANEAGRQEYLSKIRAVEEIRKNGGVDMGGEVQRSSDATSGASEGSDSGISGTSGSTGTSSGNIKLAGWDKSKSDNAEDLPDFTLAEYKAVIPSTDQFLSTGKIQLPSLSRGDYNTYITSYAQRHIKEDTLYGVPDLDRFDINWWDNDGPRFDGEGRLRKDLLVYLNALHDKTYKQLNTKKITLNSTFRTIAWQSQIENFSQYKKGPHMGAIAVDIAASGNNRYVLADTAYNMGFGGIAVGEHFIHIDIGPYHREKYAGAPKYVSPTNKYGTSREA